MTTSNVSETVTQSAVTWLL